MTIDPVLESFNRNIRSINHSLKDDLRSVKASLEAAKSTVSTSTNQHEIWTAGANIASISPQPATSLRPVEIYTLMKGLDAAAIMDIKQSAPSVHPTPQPAKKAAVAFLSAAKAVVNLDEPQPAQTPQTGAKVRSMLSVWEDKIQKVATPHYGKTPMSGVPQSNLKRKQDSITAEPALASIEESPAKNPSAQEKENMDLSFDGPILEIPDDLLAELEGLDPEKRQERLSVLRIEVEERRKSMVTASAPEPEQPPSLTGRVAAALKLFTGTSVPKRDFGLPSIPVVSTKAKPAAPAKLVDEALDGIAIDEKQPVKFYDVQVDGVIAIEFEDDEEIEGQDPEVSQLHAAEAAQAVAEEEAVKEELEKSAWLADIEEIKIVSTPAKHAPKDKHTGDWSAVSQKMNLSCTLTPVVPGRRSCIAVQPVMIPLGSKVKEDQYEISDKDTDSENELSPNSRAKKHIPAWCVNWRQKTIAQVAVDPESIFGVTVPKCDLDVVFIEKNYRKMGLQRPKRVRGSSGNWTFDKLTQEEVDKYRAKLGQVVRAEGVFIHD